MTTTAAVNTVMTTESVNMTTLASVNMEDYHTQSPDKNLGYEYLVSWYIGQIPADAVRSCSRDSISFLNVVNN